jgi:regulator of RNase E activity RraA
VDAFGARELLDALRALPDATAELSDRLDAEGYRLAVPSGVLVPLMPDARVVGRALTLRYLPARGGVDRQRREAPGGLLGNAALAAAAREGDVMVVQSPRMDVSVLGSEAAANLRAAGIVGAVVDGAVRDTEGLLDLAFPTWARAWTPVSGRWRLEAGAVGEPVSVGGVQVRTGDLVVADRGGVCLLPADRAEALIREVVGR